MFSNLFKKNRAQIAAKRLERENRRQLQKQKRAKVKKVKMVAWLVLFLGEISLVMGFIGLSLGKSEGFQSLIGLYWPVLLLPVLISLIINQVSNHLK